jgi:hypothetical protein
MFDLARLGARLGWTLDHWVKHFKDFGFCSRTILASNFILFLTTGALPAGLGHPVWWSATFNFKKGVLHAGGSRESSNSKSQTRVDDATASPASGCEGSFEESKETETHWDHHSILGGKEWNRVEWQLCCFAHIIPKIPSPRAEVAPTEIRNFGYCRSRPWVFPLKVYTNEQS